MTLLAIDTATENCSAALEVGAEGSRVIEMRLVESPRGHAGLILGMVQELLEGANLRLQDLSAIAFGRGPGSFTGVRLAASVVQGLAFGAKLPVIPISTLQAVALQALDLAPAADHVLVCNDARMHEVYTAAFRRAGAQGQGSLTAQPLTSERVMPPKDVRLPESSAAAYASTSGAGWVLAGRGFAAYAEELAEFMPAGVTVLPTLLPRAREILLLARDELRAGRTVAAEQALPVYLRDEVAKLPA